ncbi:choice-of-anchor P family protein [Actinophytocola gossypii]|uniref:LPXTG cell wall anchor domain-containing protein n=1 Tax=Actinophytocola gossypii TaxID=2812003 RepID=A0ABT2J3D3_9PSEU|nr:choice-of-anchor P family protein [Actinophytocola gossypii]MCT2582351.1 hypothetical protein [Actinophytocola gossypii]
MGGLAGATVLAALLSTGPAAADPPDGPSGSAFALSVRTELLDAPLVEIDPRPSVSYPDGGAESVARIGPDLAGLVSASVLDAASDVDGDGVLTSRADIAQAVVQGVLSAKAVTAECQAGPDGLTGESNIAELTVLGQRIDVTAPATINVLDVATVRIGEQIRTGDTLTVNAVHVTVGGPIGGIAGADVVLSQATCTAGGAPTTPPETTEPTTEPPTTTTETPGGGDARGGVTPAANDDVLARTGVSTILPVSIGAVLLLAGGATVYLARRRT